MRASMVVAIAGLACLTPAPAGAGGDASSPFPRRSDGFEGPALAGFWLPGDYGTGLHAPGSVVLSKDHARSGTQSAKLTVREGDVEALGDDGRRVERAEIDSGHLALLGRDVYYGFSILIPEDFPIVPDRLVIASVKQSDVEGSPLIGQRFQGGRHAISIRTPGAAATNHRFDAPPIPLGRWFDMVYRVRYSEADDGRIEVWMDGTRVVARDGPTASRAGADRFYHKVGPYRDRIGAPMTLYVDNYSVGESFAEVDPAKFAGRR